MMSFLRELFFWVCSQQHAWTLGGVDLPFCQRCTGLYVGAVPALVLFLVFKPRPSASNLWLHGILMLVMAPFGYHLVSQNAEIRTLTGQFFAFGSVYYLMLLPAGRLHLWDPSYRSDTRSYYLAGLTTLPLLQLAVHLGGLRTAIFLSWSGFVGLVIYALLVATNLMLASFALWHRQWREPGTSQP